MVFYYFVYTTVLGKNILTYWTRDTWEIAFSSEPQTPASKTVVVSGEKLL